MVRMRGEESCSAPRPQRRRTVALASVDFELFDRGHDAVEVEPRAAPSQANRRDDLSAHENLNVSFAHAELPSHTGKIHEIVGVIGYDGNLGPHRDGFVNGRLSVVVGLVELLDKFHVILLFSGGENRLNVRQ
jgi:hypothetical protein